MLRPTFPRRFRAPLLPPRRHCCRCRGTGAFGWVLNIVMVLVSGDVGSQDISSWPGGLAFAQILYQRAGKVGFLVIWPFVCSVAFFVVTTALLANARSFYAFSRDNALPDRGFFARVNKRTGTTVNAVWLVVIPCMALGCLALASYTALTAIFALAALGMDSSYLVPIVARWIYWTTLMFSSSRTVHAWTRLARQDCQRYRYLLDHVRVHHPLDPYRQAYHRRSTSTTLGSSWSVFFSLLRFGSWLTRTALPGSS